METKPKRIRKPHNRSPESLLKRKEYQKERWLRIKADPVKAFEHRQYMSDYRKNQVLTPEQKEKQKQNYKDWVNNNREQFNARQREHKRRVRLKVLAQREAEKEGVDEVFAHGEELTL